MATVTLEMQLKLDAVLKAERQWLRPQRLQYAKLMRDSSTLPEDKQLWALVIKANSY